MSRIVALIASSTSATSAALGKRDGVRFVKNSQKTTFVPFLTQLKAGG
jgi:hypothetical protein